ncbi:hypothetical protein B0O99DRAFT_598742 [Bisporella sp. PMI_857]|nr:hypothetical protein B0O99DRAFT_598742 [Bisporella sp. PMI_857]
MHYPGPQNRLATRGGANGRYLSKWPNRNRNGCEGSYGNFYPPKPIITSIPTGNIKEYDFSMGQDEECFFTLPKFYVHDVDAARLNSRAWVLQERLLALTTLHFYRDRIYCEQGEYGVFQTSEGTKRSTVGTAPVPELEILRFTGPYETHHLPFSEPVSVITRLKLRKVPKVGSRVYNMESALRHEDALPKSPFRHQKGIENLPVPLCSRNDCLEILDENTELVGLFSLDTTDIPPET